MNRFPEPAIDNGGVQPAMPEILVANLADIFMAPECFYQVLVQINCIFCRVIEYRFVFENVEHRVLTYADLRSAEPNPDPRPPARQIDVHLTANMERYMWSIDGVSLGEGPDPIPFRLNERGLALRGME